MNGMALVPTSASGVLRGGQNNYDCRVAGTVCFSHSNRGVGLPMLALTDRVHDCRTLSRRALSGTGNVRDVG
jgi:hypothetical protein